MTATGTRKASISLSSLSMQEQARAFYSELRVPLSDVVVVFKLVRSIDALVSSTTFSSFIEALALLC